MKKNILIGGLLILLIVVVVAVYFFWVAQQKSEVKQKVTLAAYAGDTGLLPYIAQEQGFFEENGLEVEIKDYEAGKLAFDALQNGQADFATAAEFVFVSGAFNNVKSKIIGTVSSFDANQLVARKDSRINEPQDLKGKKIAVTKKSGAEFFLGVFLLSNNIKQSEVEIIDLKPSDMLSALKKREVDAVLVWDPNVYEIKKDLGDKVVSWSAQFGQDITFLLLASDKILAEDSGKADKLLRSLLAAEEYVKENQKEAKNFVQNKFDLNREYIDYIWPKIDFKVSLEQSLFLAMEDEARWRIESGISTGDVPNFYNLIYVDILDKIDANKVSIIR